MAKSKVKVPVPLFDAIIDLDAALRRIYGADYAFKIMGRSEVLAQSTIEGIVFPVADE